MADQDDELLLETQADEEGEDQQVVEAEGDEEEPEGFEVSFDDGAAPAQSEEEQDNPVIRGFRERERKLQRRVRELERGTVQTGVSDPGPEPIYEGNEEAFDFDEHRYVQTYRDWSKKNGEYDAHVARQEEGNRQIRAAYDGEKAKLALPQIDDAERRVFGELEEYKANALILAKSPALVAALDAHPAQLSRLAEITDPVEFLMAVGELKGKLKMTPRRKAPDPERIERGSARVSARGQDKQEQALEREAEKTGDRTKLIAFRKQRKAA